MPKYINDNLPIIGGITMPFLSISISTMFEAAVIAAIGSLTGAVVKWAFDRYLKKPLNKLR